MGLTEKVRCLELLIQKTQIDIDNAEKECKLIAELILRRRFRNICDSKPNVLKERRKRKKPDDAGVSNAVTSNLQNSLPSVSSLATSNLVAVTPKAKKAKISPEPAGSSTKKAKKGKNNSPQSAELAELAKQQSIIEARMRALAEAKTSGDEDMNDGDEDIESEED